MFYYKFGEFYEQLQNEAFSSLTPPGTSTPYSGIYRCEGCGHEVTSIQHHTLPPQNHHQYAREQGSIRWRLIAATKHNQ